MATSGEQVGDRYRVIERIGSGGMASVMLAQDERLQRPVALKRLHQPDHSDLGLRLQREAKLGASLNHPNIVKMYDVFEEEGDLVLVMEYVKGGSLEDVLREGRLEPERALGILRALAEALEHAHANGIVHRDVKPANVLLTESGDVKLADLGIAVALDATRVTQSGTALGSVAYMAPEQLEGHRVTDAADTYSLAALSFELLSGRKARTGETPMAVVHQVAQDEPPDLREALPEAPRAAAEVLQRGMATDPGERPATPGALVAELEEAFGAVAPEPAPPPPPPEPRAVAAPIQPVKPPPDVGARPEPVREPDRPTPRPAPPVRRQSRDRRYVVIPALALALAALLLGAVVLGSGGGGEDEADRPRGEESSAAQERDSTGARGGATDTPASPAPAPPAAAVRSFYERAAADDFEGAWRFAGEGFRSQLGGYEAFRGQFSTLQRITFGKADVVEQGGGRATVAVTTVAEHTNKTDRCSGNVQLSQEDERWLIQRIGIQCGAG